MTPGPLKLTFGAESQTEEMNQESGGNPPIPR